HIVVPLMRNNCRGRIEARPAAWTRRIVVVSVMAGNKPLWRQQANVALKEQLLAAAQRWVQSRGLQLEEARPDEQHDKT
ncbi:MAG: hypothetical protein N2383_03295, partial [Caldilineales bacterium]|nr:hypothetical protein [Caldilineales bacterium]